MAAPRVYVAVIGPGQADPEAERAALRVGELLARAGAVVVCGGLGGVMEAACRGAEAAGGTSLAILPGESRAAANPHATLAIPSGMGEARNVLVVRSADAVVAVGGGFGTLSELALALKLGKPVVGLGTWELARAGERVPIPEAATPEEAVAVALSAAQRPEGDARGRRIP